MEVKVKDSIFPIFRRCELSFFLKPILVKNNLEALLCKTQSVSIHFLNYISRKSLERKLSRFTDIFSFSSPAGRQSQNAIFH